MGRVKQHVASASSAARALLTHARRLMLSSTDARLVDDPLRHRVDEALWRLAVSRQKSGPDSCVLMPPLSKSHPREAMCNCFTPSERATYLLAALGPVRCPVDHRRHGQGIDVSPWRCSTTMTSEVKYICPKYRAIVTTTDTPVAPLPSHAAFDQSKSLRHSLVLVCS